MKAHRLTKDYFKSGIESAIDATFNEFDARTLKRDLRLHDMTLSRLRAIKCLFIVKPNSQTKGEKACLKHTN